MPNEIKALLPDVFRELVDGERLRTNAPQRAAEAGPHGLLNPEAIADVYWLLHTRHRSAWTQELDLRPYKETFWPHAVFELARHATCLLLKVEQEHFTMSATLAEVSRAVEAELNYSLDTGQRPVPYTFEPPAGVPRYSGVNDPRRVTIRNARLPDHAADLTLDIAGFELHRHRSAGYRLLRCGAHSHGVLPRSRGVDLAGDRCRQGRRLRSHPAR